MKMSVHIMAIALLTLGCLGAAPQANESYSVVYAPSVAPLEWWVVNDTVMGGRSRSAWSEPDPQFAVFEGYLSLENNGGFTSVRSTEITPMSPDVTAVQGEGQGDGRQYRFAARSRRIGRGVNYPATSTRGPVNGCLSTCH